MQPLEGEPKAKKRKGEDKISKQQKKVSRVPDHRFNIDSCFQALAPHLQLWTDRRAELHGEKPSSGASKTQTSTIEQEKRTEILGNVNDENDGSFRAAIGEAYSADKALTLTSFGDYENIECYLCAEGFDKPTALFAHELFDYHHHTSLQNEPWVTKVKELLAQNGVTLPLWTDPYKTVCTLCQLLFENGTARNIHEKDESHKTNLAQEDLVVAGNEDLMRVGCAPRHFPGNQCWLCRRNFLFRKNYEAHESGENGGTLHQRNLANADLVAQANAKLAEGGMAPRYVVTAVEEPTPAYRDRAKERRDAFGTSGKISFSTKRGANKPKNVAAEEEEVVKPSKGASLLGKMGWTVGEGLGAHSAGRTAPIATELYVPGVGLGALGGRMGDAAEAADRNTRSSYSDFLEKTKEKAKERFGQM